MESRTTPSLSFSMPGRMSATVRGRRGGGQIWLTVRRTGCFFFHGKRSWREPLTSGILEVAGSRPGVWMQRASLLGDPLGAPKSPLLGPHYLDPGVGTGRRARSGTGYANLRRTLV